MATLSTNRHTVILFFFGLMMLFSHQGFAANPGGRFLFGDPPNINVQEPNNFANARDLGWNLGTQFFSPLTLHDQSAQVPTFLSWYPISEIIRMKALGFKQLGIPDHQQTLGLSPTQFDQLFSWNKSLIGVHPAWSLDQYEAWRNSFGKQEHFIALNELQRVVMNRVAAEHVFNQIKSARDCFIRGEDFPDQITLSDSLTRSPCLTADFPMGSVIAKLDWTRVEASRPFPVFRTLQDHLKNKIADLQADWQDERLEIKMPSSDEILTAETLTGERHALTGVHFMIKNQLDWTWLTFWWSPQSLTSFRDDQTFEFQDTMITAKNYSQCTVTSAVDGNNQSTWCSNPYIEHGPGNLGTNCISCHQFAGTKKIDTMILKDGERTLIRNNFPTDYVWSLSNGPRAWIHQFPFKQIK